MSDFSDKSDTCRDRFLAMPSSFAGFIGNTFSESTQQIDIARIPCHNCR